MPKESQLECILNKIECLRRDLSAEITVKEEIGHCEDYEVQELVCDIYCTGPRTETRIESKYIIDEPRITAPDTQKRETAKSVLEQLYCSSDWYTARYAAGLALSMPQDRLKDDLKRWKAILKKELRLPKTELENVGKTMYTTSDYAGKVWDSEMAVPDFKRVKKQENIEKISKAKEDMKGLGYSNLDLFALRHPVAATITAVTAAAGAGYALFNYLIR